MRLTNLISVLPFWNTSTFGVLVSTGKALFEAGLHAISGGLMSAVEGGKFMAGALSGFVSSMVSSGIQSLGQTGATVTTVVDGKGVTEALQNGFGQNYMKAVMVVAGGLSGGLSSTVAGGNFWQGMRQGLITSGLNHMAHIGAIALNRAKGFVVAGIYGGGGDNAGDNPLLKEIVEGEGGTMFTSYVGEGDGKIIDFLKQGYNEGKGIKIYGYSRGGNAGIRITNTLGEMGINVFQLVTFDPHSITDGGLELKFNNVAYFYNYFQRNPRTGGPLGWWGKNPYNGSRVKVNPDFNVGGFQTGYSGQHYKDGNFVSHLNIISHAYGK